VHSVTPRLNGGPLEEDGGNLAVSRVDVEVAQGSFIEQTLSANAHLHARAKAVIEADPGSWLLHAHDWLVAAAAIQLRDDFGLPLLATIHATEYGRNQGIHTDIQRRVHREERRLVVEADALVACSQFMANQIRDVFEVPASKLRVIPNGVDVRALADGRFDHPAFRAGYAAPKERLAIYVGRLVAEKGIDVVLAAVPAVLEVMPDVKFVIVGTGPALEQSRQMASHQDWAEHVLFTGFVSDEVRNRLYQVADVAMFPSLYEPFGIVALEGMAAKVPVVTSNSGGLAEVVDREETGIVVDAGSADALAWGVVHALEQPELSHRRVERAYAKVITEFDWDAIAGQTVQQYEKLGQAVSS
jgi:glycosyltransferase involved in cell wall biosynthesis